MFEQNTRKGRDRGLFFLKVRLAAASTSPTASASGATAYCTVLASALALFSQLEFLSDSSNGQSIFEAIDQKLNNRSCRHIMTQDGGNIFTINRKIHAELRQ